jgi:hypothetical protein
VSELRKEKEMVESSSLTPIDDLEAIIMNQYLQTQSTRDKNGNDDNNALDQLDESEVALKAFDGECYNSGEPCHLLNDLENKVRQEWDFYFDLMTRWEGIYK